MKIKSLSKGSQLSLTFLGTGDAGGLPLYGCECHACVRAQIHKEYVRKSSAVLVECGDSRVLIDAGLQDLTWRFPPGFLSGILLTHYHPDHVQGLLPMRWGRGAPIVVWGPPDTQGFADLYKHNGLLRFERLKQFVPLQVNDIIITPLPLIHSKLTFGFYIERDDMKLAYLTDTVGLPRDTLDFLVKSRLDCLVLDCTFPPKDVTPGNHNDLSMALKIISSIGVRRAFLTHIGHEMDEWLLENRESLPDNVLIARDGLIVDLP